VRQARERESLSIKAEEELCNAAPQVIPIVVLVLPFGITMHQTCKLPGIRRKSAWKIWFSVDAFLKLWSESMQNEADA
jgi:hypothetical protein